MRTFYIIPLVLAFAAAQMVPLTPASASIALNSSRSNIYRGTPAHPPAPHKATTNTGSKSNSSH